jgi:hypothetical protein
MTVESNFTFQEIQRITDCTSIKGTLNLKTLPKVLE